MQQFTGVLFFNDVLREVFMRIDGHFVPNLVIQTSSPGNPVSSAYAALGGNNSNTPSRHGTIQGTLVAIGANQVAIDIP